MKHTRRSLQPTGFTLVELMVVITLIGLLAGILVVAIGRWGVKAREESTRVLISRVSAQVQERIEALEKMKSQAQWTKDANQLATSLPGVNLNQAKVLLFKRRMKVILPQSFLEFSTADLAEFTRFVDPQGALSPPVYTSWLAAHPTHKTHTESAAVLHYLLTSGKSLGIPSADVNQFTASQVLDTDGDGLLELVDAWQRPLRFYRWPTRLFCPTGTFDTNTVPLPMIDRTLTAAWKPLFLGIPAVSVPDPLTKDHDDPTLLLYDANSSSAISLEYTESNYHTPRTYHTFLVVSSGPDGQKKADPNDAFGLFDPSDISNYGYLAQPVGPAGFDSLSDNITNRNK